MPEEEPGEDRPGPRLPDRLDRLWIHPSELRSAGTGAPRHPRLRRVALAGLVGVAVAAVAAATVLAVTHRAPGGSTSGLSGVARTASRIAGVAGSGVVTVTCAAGGSEPVSGVVMAADLVLTDAALAGCGSDLRIGSGNTPRPAALVGTDPTTGLALLRVPGADLAPLPVRDGAAPQVGEELAVVGPGTGGREQFVSCVVAALDETVRTPARTLMGVIVADVAPDRTRAGDALLDRHGMLVGILTGPDASHALAVPVDEAVSVTRALATTGSVLRGWLGVVGVDAGGATGGVAVRDVLPGSPASRAGVDPGDVITALDDDPVTDMDDLQAAVRSEPPGTHVYVHVQRTGTQRVLEAVVTSEPTTSPSAAATTTTLAAVGAG